MKTDFVISNFIEEHVNHFATVAQGRHHTLTITFRVFPYSYGLIQNFLHSFDLQWSVLGAIVMKAFILSLGIFLSILRYQTTLNSEDHTKFHFRCKKYIHFSFSYLFMKVLSPKVIQIFIY